MNAIEVSAFFVVGINHEPGRMRGVCLRKHLVFGFRVFDPLFARLQIQRTQFPTLGRVGDALLKTTLLLCSVIGGRT